MSTMENLNSENKIGKIDIMGILQEAPNVASCVLQPADEKVYICSDIGSTTQRFRFFDLDLAKDEKISKIMQLETAYAVVPEDADLSSCASASKNVLDNLDLLITGRSLNGSDLNAPEPMIKSSRVIKGSLLRRMNLPVRKLTADSSKADSDVFYTNILIDVALTVLAKALNEKSVLSKTASVDLTIALPPDDANLAERVNVVRRRLAGLYTVEFLRLGIEIRFSIQESDIFTGSEPLCAALKRIMQDDFPLDQNCAFLDCGGRSSGEIIYYDEVLREGSSVAFNIGGTKLLDKLANQIAIKYGVQKPPKPEILIKCLETGVYKQGGTKIDVTGAIDAAKAEFAEPLYNEFSAGLSLNDLQCTDLEVVYCSGRSFGVSRKDGKEGGEIISVSAMDHMQKLFALKSPTTVFVREEDPNAVIEGLIYVRLRNIE